MTRVNILQTDFTSGELDPRLLGRTDLSTYENGAARLENVTVEITGGVRRRPGMAYIAAAAGRGRLTTFEPSSGGTYLFVFTDQQLDIYQNNNLASTLPTPWSEEDVKKISWGEFDDSMIVTHPNHAPQQVTKITSLSWTIDDLAFSEKEDGLICVPFARFANPEVTLTANGIAGAVTLTGSDDVFLSGHI